MSKSKYQYFIFFGSFNNKDYCEAFRFNNDTEGSNPVILGRNGNKHRGFVSLKQHREYPSKELKINRREWLKFARSKYNTFNPKVSTCVGKI